MIKNKDILNWIDIGSRLYGDEIVIEVAKVYSNEDMIIGIERGNKKIIYDIVHRISEITNKAEETIWRELGNGFINNLQAYYPSYFICDNEYLFLKSLKDILKYVNKSVGDMHIGEITVDEINKKQVIMTFTPEIGYVDLIYGILDGCEEYFNEILSIEEMNKTYEKLVLRIEFPYDIYDDNRYTVNNILSLCGINFVDGKIAIMVFLISLLINEFILKFESTVMTSALISIFTFAILSVFLRSKKFFASKFCKGKNKNYHNNSNTINPDQFKELYRILSGSNTKEEKSIVEYKGIGDDVLRLINRITRNYEAIKDSSNEISNNIDLIYKNSDENIKMKEEVSKILNKNISTLKSIINVENIDKGNIEKYVMESVESYKNIDNFDKSIASAIKIFKQVKDKEVGIHDRIKNIQQSSSMMDSISEKINLSSINASIIATRPGEEERGVAEILDFLRRLAEQSGMVAKDIKDNSYNFSKDVSTLVTGIDQQYKFWEEEVEKLHKIKNINYECSLYMQNVAGTIIKNTDNLHREYGYIKKVEGIINEMEFVESKNSSYAKKINDNIASYIDRIEDLNDSIDNLKEIRKAFNDYMDSNNL